MGKMKGLPATELITYGVFCSLATVILFPALKLGLGGKGDLGPGLLPFAAGLCVLGTGITLALSALLKREKIDSSAESEKIDRKGWLRAGGILVNFTVWPLLVGIIGYILSTFLISLGLAKAVGYQDWKRPIMLSLLITVCIWLIFGILFDLDLPSGFSS